MLPVWSRQNSALTSFFIIMWFSRYRSWFRASNILHETIYDVVCIAVICLGLLSIINQFKSFNVNESLLILKLYVLEKFNLLQKSTDKKIAVSEHIEHKIYHALCLVSVPPSRTRKLGMLVFVELATCRDVENEILNPGKLYDP